MFLIENKPQLALCKVMAWRIIGDKLLPELMIINSIMQISEVLIALHLLNDLTR